MLKFSEIFEFSKEKFQKIPILKEFEWFEWFGPSPTEPFNSGRYCSADDSCLVTESEDAGWRSPAVRAAAAEPQQRSVTT